MAGSSAVDHNRDHSEQDEAATTMADPCRPLEVEIEVLKDQIAVLEEGLPRAPGAQRTALANEINSYRAVLDARQGALRQCRGIRG